MFAQALPEPRSRGIRGPSSGHEGRARQRSEWHPEPDPSDRMLIAHVFKGHDSDQFVGKLSLHPCASGFDQASATSLHAWTTPRRACGLSSSRARTTRGRRWIIAGDIGAVAKIDDICSSTRVLHTPPRSPRTCASSRCRSPKPMYGLAIEGTSKRRRDRRSATRSGSSPRRIRRFRGRARRRPRVRPCRCAG